MEWMFFSGLIVLLLLLLFLCLFIFRTLNRNLMQMQEQNRFSLREQIRSQERERLQSTELFLTILGSSKQTELVNLLGKTVTLLSTKDPLSFQQVQMMDSASNPVQTPKDNSDQGEYLQWVDDNPALSSEEKELLREVNYDG